MVSGSRARTFVVDRLEMAGDDLAHLGVTLGDHIVKRQLGLREFIRLGH
jgi:hypothetical protein